MPEKKPYKFKICLVGEHKVGKTCLIKRYVFNEFSDSYISTIGAKVTKKKLAIQHAKIKEAIAVELLIWDIMGQKGFRQLLTDAYFFGAKGIIAVCDNTREGTLSELEGWIEGIQGITEEIPTVFLGNKCDLVDLQEIGLNELKSFASGYESPGAYLSSAKTGLNVENAFNKVGLRILEDLL